MFCTACGAQLAPGPQGQFGPPPPPPPPTGQPMPQPYPYQQPYPYPPPPKKDDSGTIIKVVVIVIVVLILLAVVAAALFFMGLMSLVEDLPNDPVVVMAAPRVTSRQLGNNTIWDATLEIAQVTPSDVRWDDLTIYIESRDGTVLLDEMIVGLDDPTLYDDATDGWVDVQLWYVESPSDGTMDAGEAIKVTGMDERYQGATVELLLDDLVGIVNLPLNFP